MLKKERTAKMNEAGGEKVGGDVSCADCLGVRCESLRDGKGGRRVFLCMLKRFLARASRTLGLPAATGF